MRSICFGVALAASMVRCVLFAGPARAEGPHVSVGTGGGGRPSSCTTGLVLGVSDVSGSDITVAFCVDDVGARTKA